MPGSDLRGRLRQAAPYLVAGAAAGYLYHLAAGFQYQARPGVLGPGAWPKLVLGLAIAVCAFEVARILFFSGRRRERAGVLEEAAEASARGHGEPAPPARPESHPWLLVLGMAATFGYVAAVQTLGFFLATALYLAAFLVIGRYRRWSVIALLSTVGAAALMFVFMKLVYVSLPIGREPFSQVTLFLMQVMGIR
ncbi:MAG TPA: tripartite tricarboxylate transporter TctB family protein [Burkholderiales bacterium]|nr:tripartite tricarboxylate transporter TctB family protein [Burkholderiales bacterium]